MEELDLKVISNQENANLLRIPFAEEIKECINKLYPLKSLRLDGFPGIFYQNYWRIMGLRVTRFIQECFQLKHILYGINRTFIVLVPKAKFLRNFNQFRPISLCNFVYKVISKIITERIKRSIGKIISSNQGDFLEGRWIVKNIVISHEVMHKVQNHRGRNGFMVIKMDLKKAYDRIEWKFLEKALSA